MLSCCSVSDRPVRHFQVVLEHLLTDETPQLISRGVVSFFASEIDKISDSEKYREVGEDSQST